MNGNAQSNERSAADGSNSQLSGFASSLNGLVERQTLLAERLQAFVSRTRGVPPRGEKSQTPAAVPQGTLGIINERLLELDNLLDEMMTTVKEHLEQIG